MPGVVTHLKAAYIFQSKYNKVLNLAQFYLGAVCPDSVNINGHAEKSVRWPAHLRNSDINVWENNVASFCSENLEKIDKSYLLGYVLHIITDIVWDKEQDPALCVVMYKNGVPADKLKQTRWKEIDCYEAKQINQQWYNSVLDYLKLAEPLDIGTVSSSKVALWKEMILNKEYDRGLVAEYINDDFMNVFLESVCNNMLKIVKKLA